MPAQAVERKLAAILAADIAGFSRLVGLDGRSRSPRATASSNGGAGRSGLMRPSLSRFLR